MNIAGIIKASFIDYPACASTVIFLGGCNFRCGYCHNPEIVTCGEGQISQTDFFAFLEKRKRFVDAVCISGGEPTIHPELYELVQRIKALGYQVKLDTNGTNPQLLSKLLSEGLVEYVAMDIKGPWHRYGTIAGLEGSTAAGNGLGAQRLAEAVQESFALLKGAAKNGTEKKAAYELRTTLCRELLTKEDIEIMAGQLTGASCWYLQSFRQQGELLSGESYSAYNPVEMEELRQWAEQAAGGKIGQIRIRG